MAERRVSRPANAAAPKRVRPQLHQVVESEEPRARFLNGVNPEAIFKDPEWADQADALTSAIFVRGHLKRVAEAVAGEICVLVKQGKTLAEIAIDAKSKSEEIRAAYRVALEEAPRILKGKVKEPPRSTLKEIIGKEEDAELAKWTAKLLADKAAWEKGKRTT